MINSKELKNFYIVLSDVELTKALDCVKDYDYANRILSVQPDNKKAGRLLENSLYYLFKILDSSNYIKFASFRDAEEYKINNESEDI